MSEGGYNTASMIGVLTWGRLPHHNCHLQAPCRATLASLYVGGKQTYIEKNLHQWAGLTDTIPVTMYTTTDYTLNKYKTHMMSLAGGTYSSVPVLVSACLVPSEVTNMFLDRKHRAHKSPTPYPTQPCDTMDHPRVSS